MNSPPTGLDLDAAEREARLDADDRTIDLVREVRRCRDLARRALPVLEVALGEAAEADPVWQALRDIARPEKATAQGARPRPRFLPPGEG